VAEEAAVAVASAAAVATCEAAAATESAAVAFALDDETAQTHAAEASASDWRR